MLTNDLRNKILDVSLSKFPKDTQYYMDLVEEITSVKFDKLHPAYGFYTSPASTKFHGAHECGLVIHSITVYHCALLLAKSFQMNEEDIDANACIFHDLVKVGCYQPKPSYNGVKIYDFNRDKIMLPHGSESLRLMNKYNIKISNDAWEFAVAYHMGAFEKDNMEMYSKACDKYKEVLLLHTADMMATKIYKH